MEHIQPVDALIWYLAFLFSVTFHEAAHATVAMIGGDPTAYHGGQVSLDPFAHIRREPFGMVILPAIFLFMIGWPFGYASTPYDPAWSMKYPKRTGLMALAGPLSHLLLLVVLALLIRLGVWGGVFAPPVSGISLDSVVAAGVDSDVWRGLAGVLSIFFGMNLILCVFNILPLPPLDGSGVVNLFLRGETAIRYQMFVSQPFVAIIGIVIAWRIVVPVLWTVFKLVLVLLYPEMNYRFG